MRFYSLLLVAVHFACLHTSSTRSLSTSMNITEERTSNMLAISTSAEGITKELSEAEEAMVRWSLRSRLKNRMKPDEISSLPKDTITQLRLKLRFTNLQEHPERAKEESTAILTEFGEKSIDYVIDAIKKANLNKEILVEFEDALIEYWKNQKKSPLNVLKLLHFDTIDSRSTPTELELFKMWIKFSTEKPDLPIGTVFKNFPAESLVYLLDALRLIKDTKNVESMEAALLQSLRHFNTNEADDIVTVFQVLNLGDDLEHLLTNPNLEFFYGYAAEVFPKLSKEEALIKGAKRSVVLGEMLKDKNDPEAKLLLNELFKQWHHDSINGGFADDARVQGELRMKYDAYVEEMNKREDA